MKAHWPLPVPRSGSPMRAPRRAVLGCMSSLPSLPLPLHSTPPPQVHLLSPRGRAAAAAAMAVIYCTQGLAQVWVDVSFSSLFLPCGLTSFGTAGPRLRRSEDQTRVTCVDPNYPRVGSGRGSRQGPSLRGWVRKSRARRCRNMWQEALARAVTRGKGCGREARKHLGCETSQAKEEVKEGCCCAAGVCTTGNHARISEQVAGGKQAGGASLRGVGGSEGSRWGGPCKWQGTTPGPGVSGSHARTSARGGEAVGRRRQGHARSAFTCVCGFGFAAGFGVVGSVLDMCERHWKR